MDPYREPSGVACPRCHSILDGRDDGGLACANGCGEWIANVALLRLFGTVEIVRLGRPGPHHRATPLPATHCLFCRAALDDQYPAIDTDDVLTIGRCPAHGVWIEKRGRADFEAAYRVAISKHREKKAMTVDERVAQLEERVAALEELLRGR